MASVNDTPTSPYTLPAIAHGQVTQYSVFNRRRFMTGYPVWIGDDPARVFDSLESQAAYLESMDSLIPAGVEFRVIEAVRSIDVGPAVYGVDYGKGSISRHFVGRTPRGAYQY